MVGHQLGGRLVAEIRREPGEPLQVGEDHGDLCLLYTSDAADDLLCVDLGGRRIIKKKIPINKTRPRPRSMPHRLLKHATRDTQTNHQI